MYIITLSDEISTSNMLMLTVQKKVRDCLYLNYVEWLVGPIFSGYYYTVKMLNCCYPRMLIAAWKTK